MLITAVDGLILKKYVQPDFKNSSDLQQTMRIWKQCKKTNRKMGLHNQKSYFTISSRRLGEYKESKKSKYNS